MAYISDAKKIPEQTRKLIEGVDIFIVDMLRLAEPHPSHFVLEDSLQEIRAVCDLYSAINLISSPEQIKPKHTYLVGMNHTVEHEETNQRLKEYAKEGLDIQLAHDGLCIPFSQ